MTTTTFGISLPSAGAMAAPANMRAIAGAAESLGYDSVWVSDHVVAPEKPDSVYPYGGGGPFASPGAGTYYEPLTTLAWIAGATERVRLGISVLVFRYEILCTLRKPLPRLTCCPEDGSSWGLGSAGSLKSSRRWVNRASTSEAQSQTNGLRFIEALGSGPNHESSRSALQL